MRWIKKRIKSLQKARSLTLPLQLDVENSTPWDQFLISLNETIEWVTRTADIQGPAYGLRSSSLMLDSMDMLAGSRREVVRSVQYNRRSELRKQRVLVEEIPANSLRGGRLLAFQPDGTLTDGAAEMETQGFFDGNNVPCCDTWVGWFQDLIGMKPGYLVCWIPPQLIDAVSGGIEVNPEECIWWIDEKRNALADKLRQEKLLSIV